MPKKKTHKGAAKRFKVTGSGKIMHAKRGNSHLLEKKSPKRKRQLKNENELTGGMKKAVKSMVS